MADRGQGACSEWGRMMEAIRVVVVDDHTLFRQSLRSLLGQEELVEVIGEAEGLASLQELLPDLASEAQVVLMDYHLGDDAPDGVAAAKWVGEHYPSLPVLMLTMYDEREVLARAAEAGAVGYVLKDSEVADLVSAIKLASEGKAYLSPQMAEKAMQEMSKASVRGEGERPPVTPETYGLTPREMDVLERIVSGLTYSEVAKQLYVSVSQIKQLAGSIFTKLGARDKAHAAALAVARKLVPPPE